MSSILLVVGDAAVPTAGDIVIKGLLEGMGHTVTYRSDETAESPTSGFDGIVVAESVSGATIGSKYATVALPLVTHESSHLDVLGLTTVTQSSIASQTDAVWIAGTPIADGPFGTLSGTDTIFSAGSGLGWFDSADKASGVTSLATHSGFSNRIACASVESGATLHTGPAPARRAYIWPQSTSASTNLNALGITAIKNAYYWAFSGTIGSFSVEVLTRSPKAYYRMQEASGLIQDSSGLAHHASVITGTPTITYHTATPLVSEPSDRSIGFAGSGGFSVPDHADLDHGDVLTVMAWIYRSDLGVTRVISSKGVNALSWGVDAATGNLLIAKANVAVIAMSTVAVPLATWTHCAYTKNGATNKIYVNAVDRTGTVTNQTLSSTSNALIVGADYDGTSYTWYGSIDELALFSTALTQADVQAIYNASFFSSPGVGKGNRMLTLGVG